MSEETTIQIHVNGEALQAAPNQRIPVWLESIGLSPQRVIVERNGQALTRSEAAETIVEDGDRLEVVRIVAGG